MIDDEANSRRDKSMTNEVLPCQQGVTGTLNITNGSRIMEPGMGWALLEFTLHMKFLHGYRLMIPGVALLRNRIICRQFSSK